MAPKSEATRVWLVSLVLLAAVLAPLGWPQHDSFPFSTYPMFAGTAASSIDVEHVVAIDGAGRVTVVPPELVASREVLQAKRSIVEAIGRGRGAVAELCRAIAARVAAAHSPAGAVALEVRSDTFQVRGYFSGSRTPVKSTVHARCEVAR
jgi:hypothetical protein